ncbi:MAG: hypothetical protein KC475_12635 [Cyanobacteria bacterium HKST-UBA03]|nr:hypothetical protein [Cyanobacteria bacterium HKST-UBA03]
MSLVSPLAQSMSVSKRDSFITRHPVLFGQKPTIDDALTPFVDQLNAGPVPGENPVRAVDDFARSFFLTMGRPRKKGPVEDLPAKKASALATLGEIFRTMFSTSGVKAIKVLAPMAGVETYIELAKRTGATVLRGEDDPDVANFLNQWGAGAAYLIPNAMAYPKHPQYYEWTVDQLPNIDQLGPEFKVKILALHQQDKPVLLLGAPSHPMFKLMPYREAVAHELYHHIQNKMGIDWTTDIFTDTKADTLRNDLLDSMKKPKKPDETNTGYLLKQVGRLFWYYLTGRFYNLKAALLGNGKSDSVGAQMRKIAKLEQQTHGFFEQYSTALGLGRGSRLNNRLAAVLYVALDGHSHKYDNVKATAPF